jgi:hypothetical protein
MRWKESFNLKSCIIYANSTGLMTMHHPYVIATSDKLLGLYGQFISMIDQEIAAEKRRSNDSFLLDELVALREHAEQQAGTYRLTNPISGAS